MDEIVRTIETGDVCVEGLTGTSRYVIISELWRELKRPFLIVLPTLKELDEARRDLSFFLAIDDLEDVIRGPLYTFRPYDINPISGLSPHPDILKERVEALYGLLYDQAPLVLTSIEAIVSPTVPKKGFSNAVDMIEVGQELDITSLGGDLLALGYERVGLVENYGEFSVRGAVIDIFCPLYMRPLRIEVWGDRVESIREFNQVTQRSEREIGEAVILPAREILRFGENQERARNMGRLPHPQGDQVTFSGEEAWIGHFYKRPGMLMEYLPPKTTLIMVDPHRYQGNHSRITERYLRDVQKYREILAEKGEPFPIVAEPMPFEGLLGGLSGFRQVRFVPKGLGEKGMASFAFQLGELGEEIRLHLSGRSRPSLAPLAEKAEAWAGAGGKVLFVIRTESQRNRLGEILQNYGVTIDGHYDFWPGPGTRPGIYTCLGRLNSGFRWAEKELYVITEDEIFGGKREYAKTRRSQSPFTLPVFEIREGDLVVHQEHGIGRYRGLTKIRVGETEGEFVIIEYANQDRLYIPADRAGILQKYIGTEGVEPKLDQMGGRSWEVSKKKARASVYKVARELVQLYALREQKKGIAYSLPDGLYREFEATFPYDETPDQVKAIEEVLADMISERPMDRLVCGDVGFGKTEVAMRATFKAVQDGRQVAILVPTTLLAEQHLKSFQERIGPFGMKVEALSRFKGKGEQERILGEVRAGQVDVLIGTHRLLQPDVVFKNLGLLIIDEEQRFGVRQKELINGFRTSVDVISMTATPIPRTLQMSLLGIRDLSIIETPPENRLSIQTVVSVWDPDLVRDAIIEEIKRGGQVFYVYNRVQEIERVQQELQGLLPNVKMAVAHGQMKEAQLESTMLRFLKGEIDVLVCTSIIESGLDIPTANTIMIDGAERMGLAQVYQLRGRVGRSDKKAYAYLLIRDSSKLTKDGEKRLKALSDFSNLGAGLGLALHDLKIRGGGNILGFKQSGHIALVGYETYLKMVQEAVMELKGEELTEELNPEIHVEIKAFIPSEYISDPDTRLGLYRRLSGVKDEKDMERMRLEIVDRFGPIPPVMENLLWVMALRVALKRQRCTRLEISGEKALVSFESPKAMEEFFKGIQGLQGWRSHRLSDTRMRISLKGKMLDQEKILQIFGYIPLGEANKRTYHSSTPLVLSSRN